MVRSHAILLQIAEKLQNLYASYILFVDKLRAGRLLSSCDTAPWSSWLVTRPFQGCNAGSIPAGAIYFPNGELLSVDIKAGSIPARKNQSLQLLQCGRFHVVK
jgi:hypothetical protein